MYRNRAYLHKIIANAPEVCNEPVVVIAEYLCATRSGRLISEFEVDDPRPKTLIERPCLLRGA